MTEQQKKDIKDLFDAISSTGERIVIGQVVGTQNNFFGSTGNGNQKVMDKELLARAIENCQQYFWGNSAYAVVFCICRDVYKMTPNKTAFEEMVENLQYTKKRDHTCRAGTIANAFSDNPIYNEDIMKWDNFNPAKRIIKLRDELFRELKL